MAGVFAQVAPSHTTAAAPEPKCQAGLLSR